MSGACNCAERLSEPLERFSSSYFRCAGLRYTASVVCGAVVARSHCPSVGVFEGAARTIRGKQRRTAVLLMIHHLGLATCSVFGFHWFRDERHNVAVVSL